ncbi:MAG: GumC family protein [Puniceicoccaceae bacterium]
METNPNQTPEKKSGSALVHQRTWVDHILVVREHWILALLAALSLAGLFTYKKLQVVPLYRSVSILLFEPQRDRVINIQSVVDTPLGNSIEFVLRNHLTDLRSNAFRARIVESLTASERDLIGKGYEVPDGEDEPNISSIVAGSNKIALIGGNIFKFEFEHRDPQAAALLANRFSEEFIDFLMDRSRKTNEGALRFLRSQREELKLKVERAELAVQRYRQERNLVSLEESQNLIVEDMKNLNSSLNAAKLELLNLETTLAQVEEAEGTFEELASLPSIGQMGTLPQKLEERTQLMAQRSTLSLRYGKRHPRMIENASALETIETDIQESLAKNVSDFRQQYNNVKARVASLEAALEQAEKDSLELDQIAIEYNVLRQEMETTKGLFTQVNQRLNEAILASQLSDTDLRIVDRAWPSPKPFTPDKPKIYGMAAFLFLATFIGVPFGIHYLNLKLKTAADIEQQLHIPFLGEIRKFPKKLGDLHRLVLDQKHQDGVELFRQIHSQILLKAGDLKKGHTFVVTSAIPKEGKSFAAINLAASFSRHHYKTLLIDCDFRRPSIGPRMAEQLEEQTGLEVQEGQVIEVNEKFDVLPISTSTVQATELIESSQFREAMSQFKEMYDIIIIDTPPAGIFPDAGLIGNMADHFIFLTQLNKHRKAALRAILDRLDQSKAEVLGIIVNKTSRSKSRNLGAYRYADYRKYKNYYPQKG